MQAALAAPKPLDLSSKGRVLYLEDPGHDPAAFLWLLVTSFSPSLWASTPTTARRPRGPRKGALFPTRRGARNGRIFRAFRSLDMPGFRKTYVTPSIAPNLALLP